MSGVALFPAQHQSLQFAPFSTGRCGTCTLRTSRQPPTFSVARLCLVCSVTPRHSPPISVSCQPKTANGTAVGSRRFSLDMVAKHDRQQTKTSPRNQTVVAGTGHPQTSQQLSCQATRCLVCEVQPTAHPGLVAPKHQAPSTLAPEGSRTCDASSGCGSKPHIGYNTPRDSTLCCRTWRARP